MYQPWKGPAELLDARTQLLTAMITMELVNAISARSLKYTVFRVGIFKNRFLWYAILSSLGLQLIVLYTPVLQDVFDVRAPGLVEWGYAILFTAITFSALEIGKYIASKRRAD
jgi:Ca2+-transporting ATPase